MYELDRDRVLPRPLRALLRILGSWSRETNDKSPLERSGRSNWCHAQDERTQSRCITRITIAHRDTPPNIR